MSKVKSALFHVLDITSASRVANQVGVKLLQDVLKISITSNDVYVFD